MIGIFDSGRGGVAIARELLALCPRCDVLLLADRKNLPYGTKSDRELTPIVEENLKRLRSYGADRLLIGCCTASSIYERFFEPSPCVTPIIEPTARRAAEVTVGKICVIATESTVRSHAFGSAISRYSKATVTEFAAGELVGIAERICAGAPSEKDIKKIKKALEPARATGADTLVLGCTHFPLISEYISAFLPDVSIVSCVREGALAALSYAKAGEGRIIYTE
ncbi:MAG: aspartate/glutamate racemase family protein [Clostridia bacterium]|nr:aspartate/glutamate racemase family protein [Clostridia bacterium]